ncbi:hypothetical protein BKA18_001579 [Streptomyces auratus]
MFVLAATMAKGARWLVCDDKPGRPSGGTVRVHRDHVAPRRRIGRPPKLTDAELLCLAVAQVLLGFASAGHWIRFAPARLGHLFRYLPQQSAYNKRLNTAGSLISHVIEALARRVPTWHDDLRLIDPTPLPCAASRRPDRKGEPVRHGRLARVRLGSRPCSTRSKARSASLEQHGGRTLAGVFARTGQRLLALAAAIWHNWPTDAKIKRSLIAFDH